MRRIETAEELEKKAKRKARLIAILMLIILLGSTAGYAFFSSTGSDNTNTDANNVGGKWEIDYQNQKLYLSNSRTAIENIDVSTNTIIEDYTGKPLYIDSDNSGVANEIASTLGLFASRVQLACYGKCDDNLPEKNCTDNLIVWKSSSTNKVYQEDNCVFLEGDIRSADAFLYKMFR